MGHLGVFSQMSVSGRMPYATDRLHRSVDGSERSDQGSATRLDSGGGTGAILREVQTNYNRGQNAPPQNLQSDQAVDRTSATQ